MRMPLDAVDIPTPDTTAAENGRLLSIRVELAQLRHEFDAYKARANEYDELRSLRSDLRQFIEKSDNEKEKEKLHERLRTSETLNAELKEQLDKMKSALSEATMRNAGLLAEAKMGQNVQSALLDAVQQLKVRAEVERETAARKVIEAEDHCALLNARLDEAHADMAALQKETQWAEQELASSSQHISALLHELSEDQTRRPDMEASATALAEQTEEAAERLLSTTQADLQETLKRNAILETEIADMNDRLAGCEISLKDNIEAKPELPLASAPTFLRTQPALSFTVVPDGTMENMLVPLSGKKPPLESIKLALGIRSISVIVPDDFVWISCPDFAYFVKAATRQGKRDNLTVCKNKSVKRLQREKGNELLPYFSGAYYYAGTYTVGAAETLTLEEFERLPEKAQRGIVNASGKASKYKQLRELYLSGSKTGLKFPVRRVGYNVELCNSLRQALY